MIISRFVIGLVCLLMAGVSFGQFRPTMPLMPKPTVNQRPPVQSGGFSGQQGNGGSLVGMMGMQGGNSSVGGMGINGGNFGFAGMMGNFAGGGGVSGIGMGGVSGMAGVGNNNPFGTYLPGTVVRPQGSGGPFTIIPIQPGYMLGQQGGISGGFSGGMQGFGGGFLGNNNSFNGFGGNFGSGGIMGGGQFGLGGGGFGGMKGFGFNGCMGL